LAIPATLRSRKFATGPRPLKAIARPVENAADSDKFFCTAARRMLNSFMTFATDSRV
jgi:hypothetical protein